jgi:translocation and assembly module TamB
VRKWAPIAILALLAGLLASAAWLLYTPAGARLFIAAVSSIASVQIKADKIDGRLAEGLDLRKVEVRLSAIPFSINVGRVKWSWQPARLMSGRVAVDRFSVEDVHIMDNRPESKGWSLTLPSVPRLIANQDCSIRNLSAQRVRYDRLGKEAFTIERTNADLSWHHGTLKVTSLVFESPFASATGTLEAGFLSPLLKADVTADIGPVQDSFGRLSFKMALSRGKLPEHLAGPLSIVFITPGKSRLTMDSRIGLEEKLVNVKDYVFSLSDLAGTLSGKGSIDMSIDEPYMRMEGRADLRGRQGAGTGVALAGTIRAEGRPGDYEGFFDAIGRTGGENPQGWQVIRGNGLFKGGTERAEVSIADGRWLGGTLSGTARVLWSPVVRISSSLHGRNLDPARVSPDWKGAVNIDAGLDIAEEQKGGFAGSIRASFPQSTLRGRRLFGDLKASFRGDSFLLERLVLHGKGFDIGASGDLRERLAFSVNAEDLSGLVPSVSGSLSGSGWLRRRAGQWAGNASGSGSGFATGHAKVDRGEFLAALEGAGGKNIDIAVRAQGVSYGAFRADRVTASVKGSQASHVVDGALGSGERSIRLALRGGLRGEQWEGQLVRLSGTDPLGDWKLDAPSGLLISRSRIQVAPMRISGSGTEKLLARADISLGPLQGLVSGQWDNLNLARLNPLLSARRVAGAASGNCSIQWSAEAKSRSIEGRTSVSGFYEEKDFSIPLKGQTKIRWDAKGLDAGWSATLDRGGEASGRITASGPPEMELPQKATVSAEWRALDIAVFHAWLPANLTLKGALSGRVEGNLLPGGAVSLAGQTEIDQGSAGWKGRNGAATTAIQSGSAKFEWAGPALQGSLSVALAAYGKINGRFSLPLPARLPPVMNADGPITVALTGQVREQGLIAAAMPGIIQEARGLVNIDVKGGGTWKNPDFRGGATLKDASAFLPAAGVKLEKIGGEATFSGEGVRARVRAESGGGWVEGTVDVRMREGVTFLGALEGDNFRALNLPDVRAHVSPHLKFSGNSKLVTARGEIDVPDMSIYSRRNQTVARPSSDIRVVDLPKKEKEKKSSFPLGLDLQVRIVLGKNVRIDASGLTGRLAGALDVGVAGAERITANGRIRIIGGTYQAYGVRLVVTRGNVSFTGPVEPTLDILAVRQTGQSEDVTAGVIVSGTTEKPVINLYSNRPMSDSNKLAYLVLGHPVTQGEPGQSSLFSGSAGAFEGGANPTTAAEVQTRLGLAGTGGALGGQDQAASSTIGIGRYLTPSFYVGVGRSLLTNENQVTLRYSLSKKWEVESRAGGVTGMDLFYKIEFD